jgi:hypothetical protein
MIRAMRLLCPLACLAACTFSSPKAGGGDDIDARGSGGEWSVVETLTVPTTGATVPSTLTLQAGIGYRLRASGMFYVGSQRLGDAEYYDFNRGPPIDGAANIDVGLAVNDPIVDANRTPRWGLFRGTHIYEVPWTGDGLPLVAQFHDGYYLDNAGTLTLEILELR